MKLIKVKEITTDEPDLCISVYLTAKKAIYNSLKNRVYN